MVPVNLRKITLKVKKFDYYFKKGKMINAKIFDFLNNWKKISGSQSCKKEKNNKKDYSNLVLKTGVFKFKKNCSCIA